MVDLGIRTFGKHHTTTDQQSREENRQSFGGRCSETNTFHGCFFHGHQEVNAVNGKPMAELLAETRKNTAYLRHFVKVVELWECELKEMRRDPVVKKCLDAAFSRRRHARWTMTSQQILSGVRTGTVFGMIECDVCVPEALRDCRDAASVQEHPSDTRRSRTVHAPIRRRAQHHDDSEAHARKQLSRR